MFFEAVIHDGHLNDVEPGEPEWFSGKDAIGFSVCKLLESGCLVAAVCLGNKPSPPQMERVS